MAITALAMEAKQSAALPVSSACQYEQAGHAGTGSTCNEVARCDL
jgi:hypothetical protein